MMDQSNEYALGRGSHVKATLRLGSEMHAVEASEGILSEQLVSMKEQCMSMFKEFITRHNAPIDVPDDELVENSSEDDGEISEKPPVKSKKRK